ncbi:DNA replication terminus site-binding protein [Gayadomonas joobiniege]|uniref:DNA replication terminus site-binding protein n=1 Tax=Gayadomonas joobiniege TaxID=1234606 RepID=UPI00037148BD|nr:hypothetical protein [Gayadomonas joobiniege]
MPKNKLKNLYQKLTTEIKQLTIPEDNFNLVYKISPLDAQKQLPKTIEEGHLELIKEGLLHFKQESGEIVKHVTRYPGVICVKDPDAFIRFTEQIKIINDCKAEIKALLADHGKPAYLNDKESGEKRYIANDLLFETLPMVNQLMLTRKIDTYDDDIKSASFSWNLDFIHQNIDDFIHYKEKLDKRIPYPPELLTANEWRLHIEKVKNQIDAHLDNNTLVKIIRPKPIEPVLYLAFNDEKPKTIKPKLPVILFYSGREFPVKKLLGQPPKRPDEIKNGRKYRYKNISKYLHLYACLKQ